MDKTFKLQKAMAVIYIIAALSLFIFSLWFLTDFNDLFGLKLKANAKVTVLHNNVLQPFNTNFFWFALVSVFSIFLVAFLELNKKVPDLFALIIMGLVLIAGCAASIYFFHRLGLIDSVYLALDYSGVALEGTSEYIVNNRAFVIGKVLTGINALVDLIYVTVLTISHIRFRKEAAR